MGRYPHVLGLSILANASFLECAGCFPPAVTNSYKLAPILKQLALLHFECSTVVFQKYQNCSKYPRIFSAVCPYSSKSLTMIFDGTYFKSRSFDNVSHFFCSFIVIAKNVGAEFEDPIGFTFHRRFP